MKSNSLSPKNTVEDILEILKKSFGEKRTDTELPDLFFHRSQGADESLMTYAHALMHLIDRAIKVNKKCVTDRDKALCDVFVERVCDKELQAELKLFKRHNKSATFSDVCDEADFLEDSRPSNVSKTKGQKGSASISEHKVQEIS